MASITAQEEYGRAQTAAALARQAADKARVELVAWVEANSGGKTLVYEGQAVTVGAVVTLAPIVTLDPPKATPAPPPPAPAKGGKK